MKNCLDQTGGPWITQQGGQESTILSTHAVPRRQGMIVVRVPDPCRDRHVAEITQRLVR